MSLTLKALWHTESLWIEDDAWLSDIADHCGVSQYHLNRAFSAAFGCGPMRYLRARRLSEAAKGLASGRLTATDAALFAEYASTAAFSRAFTTEFGATPSKVRLSGDTKDLSLINPKTLELPMPFDLPAPRLETIEPFHVAGIMHRYIRESVSGIPSLRAEFIAHFGNIDGERPGAAFGVCLDGDGTGFSHMAWVEVAKGGGAPELETCKMAGGRFAVFDIDEHVSDIHKVAHAIFGEWLPRSDYELGQSQDFERHEDRFDPMTGSGVIEIWVPVTPRS